MAIGNNRVGPNNIMSDIPYMQGPDLDSLIAANIASLIESEGLKPTRWSLDSGLSRTAVKDILDRKVRSPSYATIAKLAKTARVDPLRITVGPGYSELDPDEARILHLVSRLPAHLRHKLLGYAEALADDQAESQG